MNVVEKAKALLGVLVKSSKAQTALLSVTGVVALGGVGIGGYNLYQQFAEPNTEVSIEADTSTSSEMQTESLLEEETEFTEAVEETETELETEEEQVLVRLVGSSIERDLKIKIQNEEKKNIKGEEFYITVVPDKKNAVESTYKDHDNDGIIYITDIEGGDYRVALSEIEGYYTEEDYIKVTVKEKIEYVEVEVKDEIKTEAEVSPSEDAEQKEEVEVEAEIKDTVESLDSTCVSEKVDASTLNKDKYIVSKTSLGELVTKNLPEGVATAIRRNFFLVGTEMPEPLPVSDTEVSEHSNSSGVPETGGDTNTETQLSCMITHVVLKTDGTVDFTREQPVYGAAGASVTIDVYKGYTCDYPTIGSYTMTADETTRTITWTPIPQEIMCVITHNFSDGKASETQQVTGIAGTVVDIKQFDGYTSDYTGGTKYTIKEGETALTITWTVKPVTPTEIAYTITHIFSDKDSVTQTGTGKVGDSIAITDYTSEGYETTSDMTALVLAADVGQNTRTITWTKKASNATAKVSMPGTATLFVSKLSAASKLTLSVTIEDKNAVKMVDEAGITWSLKDDTAGGIVLSAATGTSVDVSTTSGTSKEGTVTVVAAIPYTIDGAAKTATLECVITVKNDSYDATKILTDDSGRILYTDNNCTKVATVADLVEKGVSTFYTNPKYTGWQTIDGKLYYYNAQNQPVTGEQIISGIKYTFGPDGALSQGASSTGIDVSKWQGNIDWNAVKAAGIEFAIIRVGYRGSETGVLVEDPYFRQNINGATAAGLKVGVYFFTQAITEAEAVEEASMALSLTEGYNLAYPIFIDTEKGSGNARANGLDRDTRTACITAFCKTVQNAGRKAGVYASKSWYNNNLNASRLNNYCIWVAQYNTECTYTGRYSIWQYTDSGKVPGIKGNVDLNISYMN